MPATAKRDRAWPSNRYTRSLFGTRSVRRGPLPAAWHALCVTRSASRWWKGGAQMVLAPGGLIAWMVVGLLAGFLAGQLVRGAGFGIIGDLVVGLIGAFVGGVLANLFGFSGVEGFWGSLLVAFIGAVVLTLVL